MEMLGLGISCFPLTQVHETATEESTSHKVKTRTFRTQLTCSGLINAFGDLEQEMDNYRALVYLCSHRLSNVETLLSWG